MDADRLDALSRALSDPRSRRGAIASTLGMLGLLPLAVTDAKKKGKGKKKKKKGPSPAPRCVPDPAAATCAGRCGSWNNNCGRSVTCRTCSAGKTCSINGSCVQVCTADEQCPNNDPCSGGCGFPSTEGTRACLALSPTIPTQTCSSTTECAPGFQCQPYAEGSPNVCYPLCGA
jgi:hypothetical protein